MTHTRTHVNVIFANPYLRCDKCGERAEGFHDPYLCGCHEAGTMHLVPCGHHAGETSACPSWSPVDSCCCQEQLGYVPHTPVLDTEEQTNG